MKTRILTLLTLTIGMVVSSITAQAFCGFYVAKADAKLFNKSSQVIIARDGNRTVVTMSNDFEGNVKDFAMVVPVPEVLQKENIRVTKRILFEQLDAYSAPRVVEYFDRDPCYSPVEILSSVSVAEMVDDEADGKSADRRKKEYKVTIEAKYTVGEFDILILSAKESDGLKRWLTDNDYKIPTGAEEVLEPYIKNNMKFFVVKVNLAKQKLNGFQPLRPLQIAFQSDKFMLPIRLGMANANGTQDMIVYAMTRNGRVETSNYRTVNLPSNMNVPEFVENKFGEFYKDMFTRSWKKEGENAVFLEYAWDLSSSNGVKCDPCVAPAPIFTELREAGAFWLNEVNGPTGRGFTGNVHFTRLHVRYDRQHFPQDLIFQATPNRQRFQGRYVLQRAVKGTIDCPQAQNYYTTVFKRRQQEMETLAKLTGWDMNEYRFYTAEIAEKINTDGEWIKNDFDNEKKNFIVPAWWNNSKGKGPQSLNYTLVFCTVLLILLLSGMMYTRRFNMPAKRVFRPFFKLGLLALLVLPAGNAEAFCGFYVAKAEADLFNNKSQVIIARDGNRTVITMSNDFEGDVKDFAMVVPVPEVLSRDNIRVTQQNLFDKLDAYSAPRIVEYNDPNPCQPGYAYNNKGRQFQQVQNAPTGMAMKEKAAFDLGVTILATYTVGEYDILILSAKESEGLKEWLLTEDYKIPDAADEVLEPYIKDNMKFFVVKVNLERQQQTGSQNLRPLQIAFQSSKFMLPIRLGMANSCGNQDMLVYTFTRSGQVETTNYRTVKIPSNVNIPEFCEKKFGNFYKALFEKQWNDEGQNAVFLEYAWDLSPRNYVKCDPCASTPPNYADLREAGVFWLTGANGGINPQSDVHITRLHVRYNRKKFPQDLKFQSTPNKQRYQGRYVMQKAVKGELTCDKSQAYYKQVSDRRKKELDKLEELTGWEPAQFTAYVDEFDDKVEPENNGWITNDFINNNILLPIINFKGPGGKGGSGLVLFTTLMLLALSTVWWWRRRLQYKSQLIPKVFGRVAIPMTILLLFITPETQAFCGFYVTKADASLFNKASEVIIARNGDKTVVTMSSDFCGDVADFAMVVPVPEVLKRENIRVAKREIFDKMDAYSGPRLVEYHDQDPCSPIYGNTFMGFSGDFDNVKSFTLKDGAIEDEEYGVKIEAKYTVGEYDILILSAKESDGLKNWLTDNDYKIPAKAEAVLEPYIKNEMKFFVVKVNLERHQNKAFDLLSPLQIAFQSSKFMLPIRLGMANSDGDQDMIVYVLTQEGRAEVTNYRTVKLPSGQNIPEFVEQQFDKFYPAVFEQAWKKEGKNIAMLEYAWDLGSNNFMKCDPCVGTPPVYADLREAGAFWLNDNRTRQFGGASDYNGKLFFTRLHVRYNRTTFPQDLSFQETPNRENFQGRYVMQKSVKTKLNCEQSNTYYAGVLKRRQQELSTLASLTGWDLNKYDYYTAEIRTKVTEAENGWITNDFNNKNDFTGVFTGNGNGPFGGLMSYLLAYLFGLVLLSAGIWWLWRRPFKVAGV